MPLQPVLKVKQFPYSGFVDVTNVLKTDSSPESCSNKNLNSTGHYLRAMCQFSSLSGAQKDVFPVSYIRERVPPGSIDLTETAFFSVSALSLRVQNRMKKISIFCNPGAGRKKRCFPQTAVFLIGTFRAASRSSAFAQGHITRALVCETRGLQTRAQGQLFFLFAVKLLLFLKIEIGP